MHVISGAPVLMRVEGELIPAKDITLTPEMAKELSYALLEDTQITEFEQTGDLDAMISDEDGARYRVNISRNNGDIGAVLRLLAAAPTPLEELCLPEVVSEMTRASRGLIIVSGGTGQGKTTTATKNVAHNRRSNRSLEPE